MTAARVRFVDQTSCLLSQLDVEAPHSRGLLAALTRALFDLRIQVVRCETKIWDKSLSASLWLVEFDAAPITSKRRAEVQAAILNTVDASLVVSRPAVRPAAAAAV